jgi:hypothetical protein
MLPSQSVAGMCHSRQLAESSWEYWQCRCHSLRICRDSAGICHREALRIGLWAYLVFAMMLALGRKPLTQELVCFFRYLQCQGGIQEELQGWV